MASAISTDPVERAQLSTFRSVGAALAGVIVGFVAPMVVYVENEKGAQVVGEAHISHSCTDFGMCIYLLYNLLQMVY